MKSHPRQSVAVVRHAARASLRISGAAGSLVSAAVLLQPLTALACSGPRAQEAINDSFRIGLISLGLTVGWFLAALLVPPLRRRVGKKGLLLLAGTCVVHPAFWLGTLSGDCGYTLRWASLLFLPLLALVLGALLRPRGAASAGTV